MGAHLADGERPVRAAATGTWRRRSPRLAALNPAWTAGDVEAKAEALIQLDVTAARAILLDNGDWDGGLADLSDPVVRRDPDLAHPGRPGRRRVPAR